MPFTAADRNLLFTTLKTALAKHSPPMVVSKDTEDTFELIGTKPVPYGSTKKIVPGMYFCSAVARKDKVTFYFFPMYFHEKDFEKLIPNLQKSLTGKTCFQFRKLEHVNKKELNALLAKGVQAWKKRGYMNP